MKLIITIKRVLFPFFVSTLLISSCDKEDTISPSTKLMKEFPSEDGMDTILVSNVDELMATVNATKEGNKLVIIKDGTYNLKDRLWLTGDNLIYKSESGKRENVILEGEGMDGNIGFIFSINGKNFGLKDISLGEVRYHGIQIHGEKDADFVYIQNVRFFNIREQMIKGSFNKNTPAKHSDYGVVENCLFEYTSGWAYQYYCGGIDVHHGIDWRISNCIFKNIQMRTGKLTEGAIHFWNNSENTVSENNIIYNCDRGIMYGLDNSPHKGGIIKNNMIHTTRDVGIYLCYASGAKVLNNTIFIHSDYQNSIEYRFEQTKNCQIINNLSNKLITERNNGQAEVNNNVVNASGSWFVNPKVGDLHLKNEIIEVIDKAIYREEVKKDIDGDLRPVEASDIGADEF